MKRSSRSPRRRGGYVRLGGQLPEPVLPDRLDLPGEPEPRLQLVEQVEVPHPVDEQPHTGSATHSPASDVSRCGHSIRYRGQVSGSSTPSSGRHAARIRCSWWRIADALGDLPIAVASAGHGSRKPVPP